MNRKMKYVIAFFCVCCFFSCVLRFLENSWKKFHIHRKKVEQKELWKKNQDMNYMRRCARRKKLWKILLLAFFNSFRSREKKVDFSWEIFPSFSTFLHEGRKIYFFIFECEFNEEFPLERAKFSLFFCKTGAAWTLILFMCVFSSNSTPHSTSTFHQDQL